MAIQYLLVTYRDSRAVLADDSGVGFTNHVLMLPDDEYVITLDGDGYEPPSQRIILAGTSIVKPLVVSFTPTAAADAAAASAAAGPKKKAVAGPKKKAAAGPKKKNA